ncbi:hypothetical protein CR513_32354, partial [Mucuna pruriens]
MYIDSTQSKVWGIITHGDKTMNKLEKYYTQDDYNTLQLNVKVRYIITCALSKFVYNKFCSCKTTKDIWDAIQIMYEGTEDIQLKKVVTLMRHYKMFTMKDDETINEMFRRFQTILNGLNPLGHEFSKSQNNLKILDSLPKKIFEKEEKRLKALKVETSDVLDYSSNETTDDEISLMSRKFKQMLKKKEKEVICFEYKKLNHFKAYYPKLRKRWYPKKRKSLMATWEDFNSINDLQDDKLFDDSSFDKYESMFDEEEISFDTLLLHSHKILIEYKKYKEKWKEMIFENENLKKEIQDLKFNHPKYNQMEHPYNKFGIGYGKEKDKSPIKSCSLCNSIEHAEQACILVKRFKRIVKKSDPKGPRKMSTKISNFPIANILGG